MARKTRGSQAFYPVFFIKSCRPDAEVVAIPAAGPFVTAATMSFPGHFRSTPVSAWRVVGALGMALSGRRTRTDPVVEISELRWRTTASGCECVDAAALAV